MMQLDDFRVPGKGMDVKGCMEIRTENIAGETSATDTVEKGIKPKLLTVSVRIPFKEQEGLRDLVRVAEAKNESGEQKIYTVTHRSANAAGIRQVTFVESVRWDEHQTLQLWKVQFTLQEYMSNPERVEKRQTPDEATNLGTQYSQILKQAAKL